MLPKSYSFNNTMIHKPSSIFRFNKSNFMNKKYKKPTTNNIISKFKNINDELDDINTKLGTIKSIYGVTDNKIISINEQLNKMKNEPVFNKISFNFHNNDKSIEDKFEHTKKHKCNVQKLNNEQNSDIKRLEKEFSETKRKLNIIYNNVLDVRLQVDYKNRDLDLIRTKLKSNND